MNALIAQEGEARFWQDEIMVSRKSDAAMTNAAMQELDT
jgi:hypothetical protein